MAVKDRLSLLETKLLTTDDPPITEEDRVGEPMKRPDGASSRRPGVSSPTSLGRKQQTMGVL